MLPIAAVLHSFAPWLVLFQIGTLDAENLRAGAQAFFHPFSSPGILQLPPFSVTTQGQHYQCHMAFADAKFADVGCYASSLMLSVHMAAGITACCLGACLLSSGSA
jgi:hypothetical protein